MEANVLYSYNEKDWNRMAKTSPFFALGPTRLEVVSCPKHADTNVCHSVGKRWSVGLRFSSVHWADVLLCLFTLPLLRQLWKGAEAYIKVAKAANSPPPSAMSSTVRIISSISWTRRLLSGTRLCESIARALENDASYSHPLTLERSNHRAHSQSPYQNEFRNGWDKEKVVSLWIRWGGERQRATYINITEQKSWSNLESNRDSTHIFNTV